MRTQPDYYYNQSAVIPFKVEDGKVKILLVSSRNGKRWTVPKGIVDEGLSPQESAQKEAIEEAGISGNIDETLIGTYKYKKWGDKCIVNVYCLLVTNEHEDWPEKDIRNRKWIDIKNIHKYISQKKLLKLVKNSVKFNNQ